MLTLPADHNMEGQAVWLWDTIRQNLCEACLSVDRAVSSGRGMCEERHTGTRETPEVPDGKG